MAESIWKRLDAHWGWVVVASTFLLFIVLYGIMYSYGILFVELQKEFGSSATLTGWVGSIPVALTVLVAPLTHVLVEHFGYRLVGLVSVIVSAAGVVATSFWSSLVPMFATYSIMFGVGASFASILSLKLVSACFSIKKSTVATGITLAGSSVAITFALLVEYLVSEFGWRVCLRIEGALYLVVGVACVAVFTPSKADHDEISSKREPCNKDETSKLSLKSFETSSNHNSDFHAGHCGDKLRRHGNNITDEERKCNAILLESGSSEGKATAQAALCPKDKSMDDQLDHVPLARLLHKAFMYPEVWMIALAFLLLGVSECFYYINMVSYMVSVGFSEAEGATFLSVMGASMLCGKLGFSAIANYLPFPYFYFVIIVGVAGCAVMAAFMVVRSLAVMLFLAAVIGGVMMSSSMIVLYTSPPDFFGPSRARFVLPVLMCSCGCGYVLGAFLGQSIDRTGSYTSALWAFIATYVVIILLFIAAPLYQRRYAPHRYVIMNRHRLKRTKPRQGRDQEDQVGTSKEIMVKKNEQQTPNAMGV